MFDVGFWEISLILILALLVIGPERLPGAARTAGLWVGKMRRYVEGVKSDVEQEFDLTEFKRIVHNQEVQINEMQQKLNQQVSESVSDVQKEATSLYDIEDEIKAEADISETNEHKKIQE